MDSNLVIGIDEAGMGPVFGPMVVSGVLVEKKNVPVLRELGIKDSKMFGSGERAHKKRKEAWNAASEYVVGQLQVVVSAEELDRGSMYGLHINSLKKILKGLSWARASQVFLEKLGGLGRNNFLSRLGFWHSGFIYESKADVKYPSVSLASIKAKLVRDNAVTKLCRRAGSEYISGYPNKNTEMFLRNYFTKKSCLPPGTRKSRKWAPITELLQKEKI
ncbi:MAG: hypothetical protein ACQESB_01360 [Elusimicrobiota bacterium]